MADRKIPSQVEGRILRRMTEEHRGAFLPVFEVDYSTRDLAGYDSYAIREYDKAFT